jgi:hypothetical protein
MRVIVKSLTRKLYDVPERREKSNALAKKLNREDLNMDVEKSKGPWKFRYGHRTEQPEGTGYSPGQWKQLGRKDRIAAIREKHVKIREERERAIIDKMIPIEEPFLKARTMGAKDKKKRKSQGKYWDNPNRYVHGYPKAVMEATVHQAAKDWGVPKSTVRKLLKERLSEMNELTHLDKIK